MKPSRLTWVDYAKGIAIILVLYRHVFEGIKYSGIDISGNIGLEYANILFFSFRMPLFFIVSGVFFGNSLKKRGLPGFIDTKARTILYPYFLWGALQVTLQLVFSKYVNGQRELYDYLYLFYLPREVEQFWYLYCLFNVTVLYAITKVTWRIGPLQNVFIGIILFYISALAFQQNITLGFLGDILHYYLFFAIGDMVSKTINNRQRFREFGSAKWIGIIAIPFCIAQVYFLMANMKYADRKYQFVEFYQPAVFLLIALVGCAFVIAVCFKLQELNRMKWLQELGRHSLYIYVAHVLVLASVRTFMTKVLGVYNVPVLLITGSIAGLLVPVLLYKACVKLHCRWLFVLPERKRTRLKMTSNSLFNKQSGRSPAGSIIMAGTTKYQSWIAPGLYGGLQKLSIPLFGVISTMVLAHKGLTKTEMGVWSLFLVITGFVEMMRETSVKTSLIKYLNSSETDRHVHVMSAALFLNVLITLILFIVLWMFAGYFARILLAPELKGMLYIFLAGLVLLVPFSHFTWILYAKVQFKGIFWVFLFRQGFTLLFIIAYLLVHGSLTLQMLVIFYCTGILFGTIVAYYFARPYLVHSFILSRQWVSQLWQFGRYVFATGISSLVFRNAEQMMLSPLLGSTAFTASQNISSRIINLADIPSQVLGDILFPKSSKKENSENNSMIKYYYEKAVGATLCFIMPVILIILIFPKLIITVLAGPQYFDAIPYLQLISFTGIFLAFLKQFGVIKDSTGRPHINFMAITVIAAVHIIFCYFFIRQFGFLGAGYALLCSHIVGFILTQSILYRYYGISFLNCFKYAFQFYPEFAKMLVDKINPKWKTR